MPAANPRRHARVPSDLRAERSLLGRLAASMAYPDPSELVNEVREPTLSLSSEEVAREWATAVAAAPLAEAAFNLYVHVPFCKSICTFCNYRMLRVPRRGSLEAFTEAIVSEAGLLGEALRGAAFGALFMGGGTPSVLSARHLERLLGALHQAFRFLPGASKTFEYDPLVMSEDRAAVLERFGFGRFSFGIQSLDPEVNRAHDRGPQDRRHVLEQLELARRHGARHVNVDFLLGLAGTTPAQMTAEVEEVLRTGRPDGVSVYFVSPTREYVAARFGGDLARFEAHVQRFERHARAAIEPIAAREGYAMRADGPYFLHLLAARPASGRGPTPGVEDDRLRYCDVPSRTHRPLYLLGLGDSARSRIFGRLLYRAEWRPGADPSHPGTPHYLGVRTTLDDEMFGYVALLLRDGFAVARPAFRRTFGVDVVDAYAAAVEKLVLLGVVEVRPDALVFCRQLRRDRLRDLLFFMPPARLRALCARAGEPPRDAPPPAAPPGPAASEIRRLVEPLLPPAAMPGGWRIAEVGAGGIALVRAAPAARVLVRLLAPAGAHPAYRSTARFDVQDQIVEGHPTAPELDAALVPLAAAVARRES